MKRGVEPARRLRWPASGDLTPVGRVRHGTILPRLRAAGQARQQIDPSQLPKRPPRGITCRSRRLWIPTSRAASGSRSTERTPRSPDAIPRQHLKVHFGRHHLRDLVDQCSAYACPMRAYARPPRRTTSTCRSPRNRSSPATSRRAHPAYACVCRIDKAPRKTPEKLGSSTRAPARTRWSQRCAYAKGRDKPDELVRSSRLGLSCPNGR